ncbi:hypothetical protein ACRAWD_05145 [Caulobacter segnis]
MMLVAAAGAAALGQWAEGALLLFLFSIGPLPGTLRHGPGPSGDRSPGQAGPRARHGSPRWQDRGRRRRGPGDRRHRLGAAQ